MVRRAGNFTSLEMPAYTILGIDPGIVDVGIASITVDIPDPAARYTAPTLPEFVINRIGTGVSLLPPGKVFVDLTQLDAGRTASALVRLCEAEYMVPRPNLIVVENQHNKEVHPHIIIQCITTVVLFQELFPDIPVELVSAAHKLRRAQLLGDVLFHLYMPMKYVKRVRELLKQGEERSHNEKAKRECRKYRAVVTLQRYLRQRGLFEAARSILDARNAMDVTDATLMAVESGINLHNATVKKRKRLP